MFLAPSRPSSGAYNCINSLWFYRWNVVAAATLCRSTCFWRLHAQHQELTTALTASGFTVGTWWQQQRCVAQHVSGAFTPIIRSLQLH